MNDKNDTINPDIKPGDTIGGYGVQKTRTLKEIKSFYYELEHKKTGARHIHIANQDLENTFSVAFKTVPADSTGVAHILEHTVLCGSDKFPVRDPFFSMLKRSLSTFMNAFTASDWTMYPFSTQNKKDYYNLMDVYLDSAFFPNIDELSFKQEGHRLEIEKGGQLVYKGVVYNEMKGAMSSQDQVMVRSMLNAMYPDTTYSNNSGGDPIKIPTLTHEQLKAFHGRHYHPSNAFFYTYGNLLLKDNLAFIENKILRHFNRIDPDTDVPMQPRWKTPRKKTYFYPLAENESTDKKCQVAMAWLMTDIKDTFEVLVLAVLEQILLGNAASPLRKALMDSQLGSALSDGTGFDAENRDTLFACGLKGANASSAGKMEAIVMEVLGSLVENGIDKELIESAIHQIEFHRKEITNTPYPYGIKLLLGISGSWFHGGDPDRILLLDKEFDQLRKSAASGDFLESRIKRYFLENTHRIVFTLKPDHEMEDKEKERVTRELAAIKSKMSPDETAMIAEDAKKLEVLQDTAEDLSCLPTLEIEDIPPTVKGVDPSGNFSGAMATCYDQPTSGIFYISGALGAGRIPTKLISLTPFFCYAFTKMGSEKYSYTDIARQIDRYTGGIGLGVHARTVFNSNGTCLPFISFSGKSLARNQEKMFDILEELALRYRFSDKVRLKQLLLEYKAGLESAIVNNGHRLAISRSSRTFSESDALSEMWSGVHQVQTIKKLTEDLTDENIERLCGHLTTIAKTVFAKDNLKMALIGDKDEIQTATDPANKIFNSLKGPEKDGFSSFDLPLENQLPKEGWSTSTSVSFVAQTFKAVRMDHEDAPALSIISKILRSLFLHREIREKGGAYGGFAIYNSEGGLFSFGSYRDPHIKATLDVYKKSADFIRSGKFGHEDIKEAILQVCSEIDKPDPPGPAARKAFYRKILSLSDADRQHFKSGLLSLTKNRVIKTAEKYFDIADDQKAVAVISSKDLLESANNKLNNKPLDLYEI